MLLWIQLILKLDNMHKAIVCKFDKERDIVRVLPGLSINLPEALRNRVVEDVTFPDTENGLTSPELVHGRIRDEFDAIEAQKVYRSMDEDYKRSKSKPAVETKVENAPASVVES